MFLLNNYLKTLIIVIYYYFIYINATLYQIKYLKYLWNFKY